MRMWKTIGIVLLAGLMSASLASAQKWQDLTNPPSFQTDTALLLTDGRVMVHEYNTPNWWALQPDNSGSYLNGTWKKLGSMPSDYAPLYFASQVLPDGVFMMGMGGFSSTKVNAFFNPKSLKWTLKGTGKDDGFVEEGMALL